MKTLVGVAIAVGESNNRAVIAINNNQNKYNNNNVVVSEATNARSSSISMIIKISRFEQSRKVSRN